MRTTYFWLLQIFTGLVLFSIAAAHVFSVHIHAAMRFFGLETTRVPAAQTASSHWDGIIIAVSAIVLLHALFGLRQTALEIVTSRKTGSILTWAVAVFGVLLFAGIIIVPLVVVSR